MGSTRERAARVIEFEGANPVVPGAVATRWRAGREARMRRLAPTLLLQRISTPEDVAQLVCAALEQEAMTGQLITVDSGQTL